MAASSSRVRVGSAENSWWRLRRRFWPPWRRPCALPGVAAPLAAFPAPPEEPPERRWRLEERPPSDGWGPCSAGSGARGASSVCDGASVGSELATVASSVILVISSTACSVLRGRPRRRLGASGALGGRLLVGGVLGRRAARLGGGLRRLLALARAAAATLGRPGAPRRPLPRRAPQPRPRVPPPSQPSCDACASALGPTPRASRRQAWWKRGVTSSVMGSTSRQLRSHGDFAARWAGVGDSAGCHVRCVEHELAKERDCPQRCRRRDVPSIACSSR